MDSHLRSDHKAIAQLLHALGITEYEDNVLSLLAQFSRNYAYIVLDQAYEVAQGSNKSTFDASDVQKAAEITKKKYYRAVPLTEEVIDISSSEEDENLAQSRFHSKKQTDTNLEKSLTEVLSTYDTTDLLKSLLDGSDEELISSDTVPSDASHDQKTIITERENSKIAAANKKATFSFQSTEINSPEPSPTSSIRQNENKSLGSITEVPSTSTIDACIESVVNGTYESASKSGEEKFDIVNSAEEIEKQKEKQKKLRSRLRIKLFNKRVSAKKRVHRATSKSNAEVNEPKPSTTSSKTKSSRAKKREVTVPFNAEINKQKPSPTSGITNVSTAQVPVGTKPSSPYGDSLLYLLDLCKADKEMPNEFEQSSEKNDV